MSDVVLALIKLTAPYLVLAAAVLAAGFVIERKLSK